MNQNQFPSRWNEEKVREVIDYYESQTEEEAVAEYEAAWDNSEYILMQVPKELVVTVRELIAQYQQEKEKLLT